MMKMRKRIGMKKRMKKNGKLLFPTFLRSKKVGSLPRKGEAILRGRERDEVFLKENRAFRYFKVG